MSIISPDHKHRIRMRSLLYWLNEIRNAKPGNKFLPFWKARDYEGYKKRQPICPICEGKELYVPDGETLAIECFCDTLRRWSDGDQVYAAFETPYITERLEEIVPIDVPPGAAEVTRENLGSINMRLLDPSYWMLLTGGTGSAKSHILCALRSYFRTYCYYISAADFHQRLQVSMNEDFTNFLIELLIDAPILIIDDYGMEHDSKSGFTKNILTYIVDKRYYDKRLAPVWMSSNLIDKELISSPIWNVRRLASRMLDSELCNVLHFTQDDYRLPNTKIKAGLNG